MSANVWIDSKDLIAKKILIHVPRIHVWMEQNASTWSMISIANAQLSNWLAKDVIMGYSVILILVKMEEFARKEVKVRSVTAEGTLALLIAPWILTNVLGKILVNTAELVLIPRVRLSAPVLREQSNPIVKLLAVKYLNEKVAEITRSN